MQYKLDRGSHRPFISNACINNSISCKFSSLEALFFWFLGERELRGKGDTFHLSLNEFTELAGFLLPHGNPVVLQQLGNISLHLHSFFASHFKRGNLIPWDRTLLLHCGRNLMFLYCWQRPMYAFCITTAQRERFHLFWTLRKNISHF